MNSISLGRALFDQRRAIIGISVAAAIIGIVSWLIMPKQEDPSLTARTGSITVLVPGADALTIEELVVIPTEDELRTVEEIDTVRVTVRRDVAVFVVDLDGSIVDPDPVWTRVERAVDRAAADYPADAEEPVTDWEVMDLEGVIVAISGTGDITQLWDAAEALEARLRQVPGVKSIGLTPEPDREVRVTLDEQSSRSLGIDRAFLSGALSQRLAPAPGGMLRTGSISTSVDPGTRALSAEDVGESLISLPTGAVVPLSSVAEVETTRREPINGVAWVDNQTVVTVGVIPRESVDVVALGERVATVVDEFRAERSDLTVEYVTFQPDRVAFRLNDLLASLLQGIAIVAAVVILAMGVRLGLTVSMMVPVVALGGLTMYAALGGILHQISIAALVMSLGLLVDNAIVVAERVQWRLDRGEDRIEAAGRAIRELIVPLAAATGTTLASYIPLLLAQGVTAEFTGAIPRVVMLTLTLSYFFAVIVTPTIAMLVLRPAPKPASDAVTKGSRFLNLGISRPRTVLAIATAAVIGVGLLLPTVQQQFFPASDRNQVVVDIELPRGSHVGETGRLTSILEREISSWDEVIHVASFAGRTAPPFYYNILNATNTPHRGQLLVTTRSSDEVEAVIERAREFGRRQTPAAVVVARKLEQGPPVTAPIEMRISGNDTDAVRAEVQRVTAALQRVPGAVDVRTTLSPALPTLALSIDEARIAELGISHQQIAANLLAVTRGLEAGEVTVAGERIPVVVRSPAGENSDPQSIAESGVLATSIGRMVPLSAVARVETDYRPVELTRRNGSRTATVLAGLAPGAAYNEVLTALEAELGAAPAGVFRQVGGSAEESAAANRAIAQASYLGGIVLLTILLLQFRSFRKVFIVLTTVPLAAVGVIPGLVIFNQPFGFTSMLGAIALVGIVVNNAIILIDLADNKRKEGESVRDALAAAVSERVRPILLTAATTVAGMIPLLFSSSSLWPPFAGAIISGLTASTALTLLVVPALYTLLITPREERRRIALSRAAVVTAALCASFLTVGNTSLSAQETTGAELSHAEIAMLAADNLSAQSAAASAAAAQRSVVEARRGGLLPALAVSGEVLRRNEALTVETGAGSIEEEPDWEGQMAVVLSVPIVNAAGAIGAPAVLTAEAEIAATDAQDVRDAQVLAALERALDIADIEGAIDAAEQTREALLSQAERVGRLVAAGGALQSDADRIELAVLRIGQDIRSARRQYDVVLDDFYRLVGADAASRGLVPAALDDSLSASVDESVDTVRGEAESAERLELRRLNAEVRRVAAARRLTMLESLPSFDAELRGIGLLNTALEQDRWGEAALVVRWTPVARATRLAALSRLDQSGRAVSAGYQAALEGAEIDSALRSAAYIDSRERYLTETEAVRVAERLADESRILFEAGRVTSSEYLDALADLRTARTARDQALASIYRSLYRWRRAEGLQIVP